MLDAKGEWYTAIRFPEFVTQIADYLKATPAAYPKTLAEMIDRARALPSLGANGNGPNTGRWMRFTAEQASTRTDDYRYRAVLDHALPLMREVVSGIMASERLDAIVYPTQSVKPQLIGREDAGGESPDPMNIANLTGFPDLIVPAGFSQGGLPIGISFLGEAWSEGKLISLGYDFEQRTRARRRPRFTPALAGEGIVVR